MDLNACIYPWLFEVPAEFAGKITPPEIELDLYPKVEALSAGKQPENTKPAYQVRQEAQDFRSYNGVV